MDISSIVWGVIAFIVGYFVGVNATFNAIENDPSILDELEYQEYEEESDEETDDTNSIAIYIEEVDGHLFVYESGTNKFMAHGKTRQEMEDVLTERFPNTIFAATEENLLQVRFI